MMENSNDIYQKYKGAVIELLRGEFIYGKRADYAGISAETLEAIFDNIYLNMKKWYAMLEDPVHDLSHAVDVISNSAEICADYPNELFPIYIVLSAGFHDARDHKHETLGTKMVSEEELREFILGVFRLIRSEAPSLFRETSAPAATEYVLAAISRSSWSKREQTAEWMKTADHTPILLTKILQDADWLEAIGSVGLKRCIDWSQKVIPGGSDDAIRARVVAHIDEKLRKIPAGLNFEWSKTRAVELMKPIEEYLR